MDIAKVYKYIEDSSKGWGSFFKGLFKGVIVVGTSAVAGYIGNMLRPGSGIGFGMLAGAVAGIAIVKGL